MLELNCCGVMLIDVQGKLARGMPDSEALIARICTLLKGARALGLPVLWLEQYPKGLGHTVPEITEILSDQLPLEKSTFSACGSSTFSEALSLSGRKQWLLCGIETHVCVYQTALGMLSHGFSVEIVSDAVASRQPEDKVLALQKMQRAGAELTSVEMCLFELVKRAGSDAFKAILPLIR